jgi:hypothetical protein
MKQSLRKISLSLVVLAAIGASGGCNRDSGSDGVSAKPAKSVADALSSSLLTKAPYGILGYYHWSLSNPAYGKLESSPWKGSAGAGFDASSAANPLSDSPAYQAFKDAGIDFTNPSTLTNNLAEVVLFVAPTSDPAKNDTPMELGALLSAKPGVDFAQKFSAIRESLRKQQITASDHDVWGFEGL